MLTWSDLAGVRGGVGGALLLHLLATALPRNGRVLLAGPVSIKVAGELARRHPAIDVLVRSWPDARALRQRLPEEAAVFCGPLRRLPVPDRGYASVLAPAGADRLESAEEAVRPWRETVGDLLALLAEHGDLILGAENRVGLDRLLAPVDVPRGDDAGWPAWEPAAPGLCSEHEVAEPLGGDALLVAWALHGPRSAPRLAAPEATLSVHRRDPVVRRAVVAAYAPLRTAGGGLYDPGTVAADLLAAGLSGATAPASLLSVRRGGTTPSDDALVMLDAAPGGDVVVRLDADADGQGWWRHVAGAADAPSGEVVPSAPTVAEMLGDLLEQYDASAAGDIVRWVARWLGGPGSSVDPARVPVLLDRLLVVEDRLAPLDRSQVSSAAASRETVLLRVLLHLARDHISSGRRHPWGNGVTPRAVAASLAAAAGIEPDANAWAAAEDLDSRLRRPGDAEPTWDAPLGGDSAAMSYPELVDQTRLLAARVAEQDAHVVWLIDAVQRRQRWLRRTRATLRQLGSRASTGWPASSVCWAGCATAYVRTPLRPDSATPASGSSARIIPTTTAWSTSSGSCCPLATPRTSASWWRSPAWTPTRIGSSRRGGSSGAFRGSRQRISRI